MQRTETERETGVVRWFTDDKGYGFITREHGADVFVHHTEIEIDRKGHKSLVEGQRVSFRCEETTKGPKAFDVRILEQ